MPQSYDIVCKIGLVKQIDGTFAISLEKFSTRKCGLAGLLMPVVKKTAKGPSISFAIVSPRPPYDLFVMTPEKVEEAKASYDFTFIEYRVDPAAVSLTVTPAARAYIENLKLTSSAPPKSRTYVEKTVAPVVVYKPVEPSDIPANDEQVDPEEADVVKQALPPVVRKSNKPASPKPLQAKGNGIATSYLTKTHAELRAGSKEEAFASIDACSGGALLGLAKRHGVKQLSKKTEDDLRADLKTILSAYWQ